MSLIGSFWGAGSANVTALWVKINRDVPYITAIGQIIEARYDQWLATAQAIEASWDLDTCVGAALDVWGARLGVLRTGLSDDAYRRLLLVQRLLVLSSAGTYAALLAVFETWAGVIAYEFANVGRTAQFAGAVPADRIARLVMLLKAAKPGGRRVVVYDRQADELIGDHGLEPVVGNTSILGHGLTPVSGASLTTTRLA